MAQAKKPIKKTKATTRSRTSAKAPKAKLISALSHLNNRRKDFLARRPHRSFMLTKRRDYARSLAMPGYHAFSVHVSKILLSRWRLFALLIAVYALIMVVLGAMTSQETYSSISELFNDSGKNLLNGGLGSVAQAGLVSLSTFAGGGSELSADQGVYVGLSLLLVWLCTVWLLRETIAGRKPKLRDGLYNSGAPIVSTIGVLLVLLGQMLPLGAVMLIYTGLNTAGLVSEGFGAMLFWLLAVAVALLVLYWATSTLIALIIVTIPGMYPIRAIRLSSDLVVGRRLRIFFRIVWGIVAAVGFWALILALSVIIDTVIRNTWTNLAGFSIVPYIVVLMTSAITVWFAAYIYLLYRKVVDDDAKPA